jgi:hypothetical protein
MRDDPDPMLKRYWILVFALAGAAFAVAVAFFPTRLSLGSRLTLEDVATPGDALRPSRATGATPVVHAMAPIPVKGFSKQQLELVVAGLIGAFIVGAIVASAFLFSHGVSADDPTACEDFGHAQAFLAGNGLDGASPSIPDRILGETNDESTRVMQLRTMFDRCYYSAKK